VLDATQTADRPRQRSWPADAFGADLMGALVRHMASRCGLEDPDGFAASGGVWVKYPAALALHQGAIGGRTERGTGRTTRTLLQAFCALECGCSVELVAKDRDHAGTLLAAARKLSAVGGVSLRRLAVTCTPIGDGRDADVVLRDHYAAERPRPAYLEPRIGGVRDPLRFDEWMP
jgi:hypothetical protein